MAIALEVIATSVADAVAAETGGAARVELVRDLGRGGLTPDIDLVDAVLDAVRIPVRVMVRETEAHVIDDPRVRAHLVSQARTLRGRRVDGLVFGAVAGGKVDLALLNDVAAASAHRVPALACLAAHPGVDLILCDGGAGDWESRSARFATWTRMAGNALRVMPGGGVTAEAIEVLAAVPEIRDLHVGRLVRTPESVDGAVSAAKVSVLVGRVAACRFR